MYGDLEVIVVDDASDDDTQDILKAYADDPRVCVLRNETNRSISASRNRGIEAARGSSSARTMTAGGRRISKNRSGGSRS
jgi:glycosyltransferase involved in cell wall biosynthesis